jgi:hypothetical protein
MDGESERERKREREREREVLFLLPDLIRASKTETCAKQALQICVQDAHEQKCNSHSWPSPNVFPSACRS